MGSAAGQMVPADTISKIVGLGLGIFLGRDVDLTLELSSLTDQDAKQLYDMANGFLALMKAGNNPPETAAMLNSLQLQQNGSPLTARRFAADHRTNHRRYHEYHLYAHARHHRGLHRDHFGQP